MAYKKPHKLVYPCSFSFCLPTRRNMQWFAELCVWIWQMLCQPGLWNTPYFRGVSQRREILLISVESQSTDPFIHWGLLHEPKWTYSELFYNWGPLTIAPSTFLTNILLLKSFLTPVESVVSCYALCFYLYGSPCQIGWVICSLSPHPPPLFLLPEHELHKHREGVSFTSVSPVPLGREHTRSQELYVEWNGLELGSCLVCVPSPSFPR